MNHDSLFKKAFEEETEQIKNQEAKIMKIFSKFDSDGSISRIMSALDGNLVHIQGGTQALTSLFAAFRRENFLPKPIKRAKFTFGSNENLYQAVDCSFEGHGSHESHESDETDTQDTSYRKSGNLSNPKSISAITLSNNLPISSSTQFAVLDHESVASSPKILAKEQVQEKYLTQVPISSHESGISSTRILDGTTVREITFTQASTRKSFDSYQYATENYPSALIPVHSQEPARATITRVMSPFYICIEVPELIETRILNLQKIKERAHDWKPIEYFDYGDKVIVRDLQTSTEPLKRARIKFIARHNSTVRVYLFDFGFDIMVGFKNVGTIEGLEFNGDDTCFLAKLSGIKPLSGFIFPSGVQKCAFKFLNMITKKYGTRVTVIRKYVHDEFTFVEIKSQSSGVEQDWSRLLIDNGYALPYHENESCFIPLKDYCYRFHALNDCTLCTREHQCPYCSAGHSLIHCSEFHKKLAQENM